jgi:hypothetical protein
MPASSIWRIPVAEGRGTCIFTSKRESRAISIFQGSVRHGDDDEDDDEDDDDEMMMMRMMMMMMMIITG